MRKSGLSRTHTTENLYFSHMDMATLLCGIYPRRDFATWVIQHVTKCTACVICHVDYCHIAN
jgi:hypothetical protein